MHSAELKVWQVLPLGVPQQNLSPYLCYSAFAMNPALLDTHQAPNINQTDFENWKNQQAYWLPDYAEYCILKQQHHNVAWYDWPANLTLLLVFHLTISQKQVNAGVTPITIGST